MGQDESWSTVYSDLAMTGIQDKANELFAYADLCNDEVGETCLLLCSMSGYTYALTAEFIKALEEEIDRNLEWFQNNSKIVNNEHTETYRRLELEYHRDQ